jgi:hypothetical protein
MYRRREPELALLKGVKVRVTPPKGSSLCGKNKIIFFDEMTGGICESI